MKLIFIKSVSYLLQQTAHFLLLFRLSRNSSIIVAIDPTIVKIPTIIENGFICISLHPPVSVFDYPHGSYTYSPPLFCSRRNIKKVTVFFYHQPSIIKNLGNDVWFPHFYYILLFVFCQTIIRCSYRFI